MVNPKVLEATEVTKRFGNLQALNRVSFYVLEGEIFGIAGPNGAGKSVLFNCISGVPYNTDSGTIVFRGKDITKSSPYQICKLGITRTFQSPVIFANLSVLENVMLGESFGKGNDRTGLIHRDEESAKKSIEALKIIGLYDRKDIPADTLSFIDRKMLMIGTSIATGPSLLLLDEPFSGLNPAEIANLMGHIRRFRDDMKMSIIVIEHVMKALMGLSDRVMMLNYGEKLVEGTPREVSENEAVIEAYMGRRRVGQ